MTFAPDKYRGFNLNIEMAEGLFVPSYNDPLKHKEDQWCKMDGCKASTQEEARKRAHKAIDNMITGEGDSVAQHVQRRFERPLV